MGWYSWMLRFAHARSIWPLVVGRVKTADPRVTIDNKSDLTFRRGRNNKEVDFNKIIRHVAKHQCLHIWNVNSKHPREHLIQHISILDRDH